MTDAIIPATDEERLVVSPADPHWTIAGIRQFGLAADGSDLRDLDTAIMRGFAREAAQRAEIERLRRALQAAIGAWNSLPTGYYSGRTIEAWLLDHMKPAIEACRAALEKQP